MPSEADQEEERSARLTLLVAQAQWNRRRQEKQPPAVAAIRGMFPAMLVPPPGRTGEGVVALFNASDDTVEMLERVLSVAGLTLFWCRFADVRKGRIDFADYVRQHNPEVVIFDISPPYDLNWRFFATLRDHPAMLGRGVVLTTTNKQRLDEIAGVDSHALEVVGKPADLERIQAEIETQSRKAAGSRPTLM
jgi:hypothetical protein